MADTPNHGYNVPDQGDEDWHQPLNENFEAYDTDIEIRDQESNLGDYDPKAGAKFLATDTEAMYVGNGNNWNQLATSGTQPSFDALNPSNNFLGVGRDNRIGDEFFGVQATVKDEEFGGMYVNGADPASWPFYGYATDGNTEAWHYYDGSTGKWHLNIGGDIITPTRLTVQGDGNVGVGTEEPATRLHVQDSVSGTATPENHVALIENTSTDDSDDVLALEMNQGTPESGNNFISFKDANGPVGAIEGDGNGGVTTASAGSDYAEWLPRSDPAASMEPGEIAGVHAGEVSYTTADADRAMVVSTQPIVAGNDPGPAAKDREGYEKVAFIGQVPVNVRGTVEAGDLIVPSGEDDGTGQAIVPAAYRPGDGPIVGRAWEGTNKDGVREVTVAVGIEPGDVLAATVEQQADRIDDLEAENAELRQRLSAVESRIGMGDTAAPADD